SCAAGRVPRAAAPVPRMACRLAPGMAARLAEGVRTARTARGMRGDRGCRLGAGAVPDDHRWRANRDPGIQGHQPSALRGEGGRGRRYAASAVTGAAMGAGCPGAALAWSATYAGAGGRLPAQRPDRALSDPGAATGDGRCARPVAARYAGLAGPVVLAGPVRPGLVVCRCLRHPL